MHCAQSLVDLLVETLTWNVRADSDMRVTNPGVESTLVQVASYLNALVTCLVVLQSVERFSTVGGRAEEDDAIIPAIAKSDPTPALLVHDGLEFLS